MTLPAFLTEAAGSWAGMSRLHLSWLDDEALRIQESDSLLSVSTDPASTFAVVSYSWEYEGEAQNGTLFVCGETGTWADSWHQNGSLLSLSGSSSATAIRLHGAYAADEGPDWGWRIELESVKGTLVLRMTNIMPTGEEDWAVEAIYRRT